MIYEIATFQIKSGQEEAFEDGVASAVSLFQGAQGCHSIKLERSIENPSSYNLVVGWDTVEHHMVLFRESDAYQQWRTLVGDFFAAPPQVQHVRTVVAGF